MKTTTLGASGPAPQGETFGEYVRKVREFRGLSKSALARSARTAYSTIAHIEAGKTKGRGRRPARQTIFKRWVIPNYRTDEPTDTVTG